MKAACSIVFAGALTTALAGCDTERIVAVARALDAGSNPGDAGVTPVPDARDVAGGAGGAFGAGGASGASDASPVIDAATNPADAGPSFGPAQVVTGLRGDAYDVQAPSMTFEELELYFTSPTGGLDDIWVARRSVASDPWGPGTLVAELSSPQNDRDPDISVDGLVMHFASDRAGGVMRLYVSQRRTRDIPWAAPVLVDTLGASVLDEAPTVDRNQLNLVFASQRGGATRPHLFAATRPDASTFWRAASEITSLGSPWEDTDPALFAGGSGLVFASRRLTQGGTADLFQANRPDASSPFASLVPLAALNTAASEEDPWLSQDGKHILFVSDRSGQRRIYEASR